MDGVEHLPQQVIPMARRVMKGTAGVLVIPKIRDQAGLSIDAIGPVRIVETRCQDDKSRTLEAAQITESALVAYA
jgi:hypothetical protein